MQKTAFERAQEVIQAANLQDIYALERWSGEHARNEVWFYGPYVLRIHPQGDTLEQETRLLRILPTSIPHAPVVAAGDGWIVQRRVEGDRLSAVWRSLDETRQRAAAQQLAAILINLHQVRISGMPSLSPGWFAAILPADIIKLAAQLRAIARSRPAGRGDPLYAPDDGGRHAAAALGLHPPRPAFRSRPVERRAHHGAARLRAARCSRRANWNSTRSCASAAILRSTAS